MITHDNKGHVILRIDGKVIAVGGAWTLTFNAPLDDINEFGSDWRVFARNFGGSGSSSIIFSVPLDGATGEGLKTSDLYRYVKGRVPMIAELVSAERFYVAFVQITSATPASDALTLEAVATGAINVLNEVPASYKLDQESRFHCEDGPAVTYKDRVEYYIRGLNVPAKVITAPQTITALEVFTEKNSEVRRVMVERLGRSEFLLGCMLSGLMKKRSKSKYGVLWEIDPSKVFVGTHPVEFCMLDCVCPSSGRSYLIPVSPIVRTPKEAAAWTVGLTAKEYNPLVHT